MIYVAQLVKDYHLISGPSDICRAVLGSRLETIRALDGINLSVGKGESLGVIGDNGAGKSTLLKILAGISKPSSGVARVVGRVSSILEVSTGFHQYLTGRENLRSQLAFRGLSRLAVARLEQDIIEFSGLGARIDQPIVGYSTGMIARLAFALATAEAGDVLLIDELLVVGDEGFQARAFQRMQELCRSGRAVVLVSHNILLMERLCNRVAWLERGQVRMLGSPDKVVMSYLAKNALEVDRRLPRRFGRILGMSVNAQHGRLLVTLELERVVPTDRLHLQVAIHDTKQGILAGIYNTSFQSSRVPCGLGRLEVKLASALPKGLRDGIATAMLVHGVGTVPGSDIDDSWGMDNARMIYFSQEGADDESGYSNQALTWHRCM